MIDINLLSFCFCSAILIYACYSDIKRGRVSNWVWILMIAVGAPLQLQTPGSWFAFSPHIIFIRYPHPFSSHLL
ncbi:MAG: prepilin peptidase [Methanophagales archaeon]|nr:prepilin peptidase [Methanophagales archaeon]